MFSFKIIKPEVSLTFDASPYVCVGTRETCLSDVSVGNRETCLSAVTDEGEVGPSDVLCTICTCLVLFCLHYKKVSFIRKESDVNQFHTHTHTHTHTIF